MYDDQNLSREERRQRYLKQFAQMPPEEQREHYNFVLQWIIERLRKLASEPEQTAHREQAAIEPEQIAHRDQDSIDATAADLLADLDI